LNRPTDLADRVLKREPRAIARLISMLEDGDPAAEAPFADIFPHGGQAYIVGITGAPGVGKSTLVDGLIASIRADAHTVAVLAVDPSSPWGGGAILGDRVRMQRHASDPEVYIRSMSARGRLGGLAGATRQATHVLDAAGYRYILVETVGVGQSELAISASADTTLVVVSPGMGDTIQTLKAGILEIADLYALNKADHAGARQTLRALRAMLHRLPAGPWSIPIVETQAHQNLGLGRLWERIQAHRAFQEESGRLKERREQQMRVELRDLVEYGLRTETLRALTEGPGFDTLVGDVLARGQDPVHAARGVLKHAPNRARAPFEEEKHA
jgi:LAO/AO transport system kinase